MKQGTKIFTGAVAVGVAASCVWHLAALKTKTEQEPVEVPAEAPKAPLPEDIVGERMADTNYVAALKVLIDGRGEVIAESQAVRAQMADLLTAAAEKLAGASSSEADEKVAGASSSPAEQQDPERDVSGTTERELETPATMAATNAPLVSTNTALKAGTQLSAPDVPPAARFDGIDPALLAQVRQQPEWAVLETRLDALAAKQQDIQLRTRALIRERMEVQYAARAAENPGPVTRSPAGIIKPMTNAPDFDAVKPTIITNVPSGGVKLPPRPDRKPITP